MVCRSPATCLMCHTVAFVLSIFFANWQTVLVGNLSRSTLPSVMVLDTKSLSHRKSQNMSWCKFLQFQVDISQGLPAPVQHCTICQHSCFLGGNWSIDQSGLAPHWIVVYRNLQTSPILCPDSCHLWIAPRICIDPFQSCQTM